MWDISKILASGVIVGGVAIGTLTFTGTDGLNKVSDIANDFKNRIVNLDTSLTSWKNSFADLKASATAKITEANDLISQKNSLIASLQSQIADLNGQITSGQGDAETLTMEIERLNAEINKANSEVEALEAEVLALQTQVGTTGSTVENADSSELPSIEDSSTTATAPTTEEPAPTEPTEPAITMTGFTTTEASTLQLANDINTLTPTGTYDITSMKLDTAVRITVSGTFTPPAIGSAIDNKFNSIRSANSNKTIVIYNSAGTMIYSNTGNWIVQ